MGGLSDRAATLQAIRRRLRSTCRCPGAELPAELADDGFRIRPPVMRGEDEKQSDEKEV